MWKLRRAIRLNLVFGTVITAGYVGLFPFVGHAVVMVFFALVLLYNMWSIAHTYQLYKRIPTHVAADHDLLSVLRDQVEATSAWIRLHQRSGLVMYPLAVTGGFLLGGVNGSGLSPAAFLAKPHAQLALVGALVVLVPLCHFLVRWMTRAAFGVHVEAMRAPPGSALNSSGLHPVFSDGRPPVCEQHPLVRAEGGRDPEHCRSVAGSCP